MRRSLSICLILALALILVSSASGADFIRHKVGKEVLLKGDEPIPNTTYYPTRPGLITQSPGLQIGWTQYDYQTNCSTGDRAALGIGGNVNFCWMNGIEIEPDASGRREVYFNCVSADGTPTYPDGVQVSTEDRSGYTTLANLPGDEALVAYHSTDPVYRVFSDIDAVACYGAFTSYDVENLVGGITAIWPYVTIDRNSNGHIVISQPDELGTAFGYTNSTDAGQTWGRPITVDNIATISPVMTSSRVSDKVALVYTRDVGQQFRGDVVYYESPDGLSWDWGGGPVNVTEYGQGGDSLWAYCDVDAVYDYNDNLHIIWNAWYIHETGEYWMPTFLYHFSTEEETITHMATSESPDPTTCADGGWMMPIAKMSIGVQEIDNALFAIYTFFPEDDCSAGGFSNGELYFQVSYDGGDSWSLPMNMTESNTNGCLPGECDSDNWSSLAERVVDNVLHIIYINDKDAGGLPQAEGTVTDNPVMYLAYDTMTGVDSDEPNAPISFALSQNYPNPFNAKTNIEFELLENSRVELSVYDITGARVATLVNNEMDAGAHSVNWNAEKVASGVYYYSLKANGEESTKKMTLLK